MVTRTASRMFFRWRWPDWTQWLRTARPAGQSITLERRHIYILPTRAGLLFAVTLICMLIGAINYSLSLGFLLTFLLAGLGIVAMLHTWRNLLNLTISPSRPAPVFAGQTAHFPFTVAAGNTVDRHAVFLSADHGPAHSCDIPHQRQAQLQLPVPSRARGWLAPGRITVYTEFPLGLFRAWSYIAPDHRCLVYPAPAPSGLALPGNAAAPAPGRLSAAREDDDFSGLREYRHGDSIRRVDWKASARAQALLSKNFAGAASQILWLDWQDAPGRDIETRLSQLTRWVLDTHDTAAPFGLRLPGKEIPPAQGDMHCEHCLQTLALYKLDT